MKTICITNLGRACGMLSPFLCRYQYKDSRHSLGVVDYTVLFFLKCFLLKFHTFGNTASKASRNSTRHQVDPLKQGKEKQHLLAYLPRNSSEFLGILRNSSEFLGHDQKTSH